MTQRAHRSFAGQGFRTMGGVESRLTRVPRNRPEEGKQPAASGRQGVKKAFSALFPLEEARGVSRLLLDLCLTLGCCRSFVQTVEASSRTPWWSICVVG